MTPERRHDWIALTILLVVPVVLFADVLSGNNCLYIGDTSAYNYPLRKVLREIVLRGDFPSWNPYLSAGQPLAANAAYQVFYPPTWLILLPDFQFGFHLLVVAHLSLAMIGMFLLLRSLEVRRTAATLTALAFGTGGMLLSTSPTFAILFSVAWIPWVCLFTRRFLRSGERWAFAAAAAALAMQFLIGEPMTVLQTGLLLVLYALTRRQQIARRVASVAALAIVGLLLAAVQIVPLLDHFRDTTRARGLAFSEVRMRSSPAMRVTELVVPYPLGNLNSRVRGEWWSKELYKESAPYLHSIYPGILFGILAAAGVLAGVRGRWLFLATLATSLILAVGDATPLLRLLYRAGIAGSIRYPEKFLILGVFATMVFAARALDQFLAADPVIRRRSLQVLAAVTVLSAAIAVVQAAPALANAIGDGLGHPLSMPWLTGAGWNHLVRAGILLLILGVLPRLRSSLQIAVLALFIALDLGTVVLPLVPRLPASFYDEPHVTRGISGDREASRLFSFAEWTLRSKKSAAFAIDDPDWPWVLRNELLPLTPLSYGFRIVLANDYDVTELATTTDFTRAALNLASQHDANWLNAITAMSNVRFVALYRNPGQAFAEARGVVRDIEPVKLVGGPGAPRYYFSSAIVPLRRRSEFAEQLHRHRFPRDVAFVEGPSFTPAAGRVRTVQESSNGARIVVDAAGPAFLVASVTAHKYWTVTVDGTRVTPVRTNLTYQGFAVPAGEHVVEMRYANPLIPVGAAVSVLTLALLLVVAMRSRAVTGTMRAL